MRTNGVAAPIIVLDPDASEGRLIAGWLASAGLGMISTVRTCDEAIFMLGRKSADLLIIDERIPALAEQRLLNHIVRSGSHDTPTLVRLIGEASSNSLAVGRPMATGVIQKPLNAHDVVVTVGSALQRTDLLGRMDQDRDQDTEHLATARRMQLGLLPTEQQIDQLQSDCCVGIAGFCQSGEAVGGDFWGAWPTGRGRLAIALADFAGHGLSAALNTFRLHAILSDHELPRGMPVRMLNLLNQRLCSLLPIGHYATMIYAQIDPSTQRIAWSSAGGPPPMFVSANAAHDLNARGLPLGVRPRTHHSRNHARLGAPGIFCMFSDGLFESGAHAPDIPRDALVAALVAPAALASNGRLADAARQAIEALKNLRAQYMCLDHSDDVTAVCVAIGP